MKSCFDLTTLGNCYVDMRHGSNSNHVKSCLYLATLGNCHVDMGHGSHSKPYEEMFALLDHLEKEVTCEGKTDDDDGLELLRKG